MRFFAQYRAGLHQKRLRDVLPFFEQQLALDAAAHENWSNSTEQTRKLYADWMASNRSSKMRKLCAIDTINWARENV